MKKLIKNVHSTIIVIFLGAIFQLSCSGTTVDTPTDIPTVSTISVSTLNESNAGSVDISITFNLEMDTATNPSPEITGLARGYTILGSTWSNGNKTWTGSFTFVDDNEEVTGVLTIKDFKSVDNNLMSEDHTHNIVVDTIAPVISTATVAADNSSMALTFSENVYTNPGTSGALTSSDFSLAFLQLGGNATAASISSVSHSAGTSSVTLNISITDIPDGQETIEITPNSGTAIYDAAGNPMLVSISTTAKNLFDKKAPILTTVTIASNNAHTDLSKIGDEVTITMISDENLGSLPSVNIAGHAVTATGTVPGTNFSATYTMVTGDTEGVIPFTINYSDTNGNSGAAVTAITSGSIVTFDKTIPAISTGTVATNNSYIDVTFNEGLYGNADGSGALSAADFTLSFLQNSGNATGVSIISVTKTTGGALAGGESVIRVNLSVTNTPKGVETIEINPVVTSIYDKAGNVALNSSTTTVKLLKDQYAPQITDGTVATNNASITVTFSENVFTTSGGSGALTAADFSILFEANSGNATNATISSVTHTAGSNTAVINLSVSGLPSGVETVEIKAAGASSIYDTAGVVLLTTETTTAKLLKDQTVPTPVLSYEQGTNSNGFFKSGNVTVTATYSEVVTTIPNISIDQQGSTDISSVPMSNSGDSKIFTYTYSVIGDTGTTYKDGTATVSLSTVADANGNNSVAPTNNSFVIDTKAPLVSEVHGNPLTGTYKLTDEITIEVVFDEDVTLAGGTGTLTLADVSGSANCSSYSGDTVNCLYSVVGGDASTDLNYSASDSLNLGSGITIKDKAGNGADLTLPLTASATSLGGTSSIKVDTIAPTLSTVAIASNNNTTTAAKVGDLITLTIESSENLGADPVVTIAGNSASVSGSGTSFSATYTLGSGDTEGLVNFSIDFEDESGNSGSTVSNTTNASIVTFDKTIPVITTASIAGGNTSVNITFNEGLYSTNSASGNLVASDFSIAFAQNSGTATGVTISTVAHTAGDNFAIVNLTVSGTPNGSETIEIKPVNSNIFDIPGNTAVDTTTTTAKNLNAANVANITGGTIASDNTYIDVTFDEGVYGDAGVGAVDIGDFNVTLTPNSGNITGATITSVTNTSGGPLTGGETIVRIQVSYSGGTPAGKPSGAETIAITPVLNSIYSSAGGTPAPTPVTNTTGDVPLKDEVGPTVTSVTSLTANGTYGTDSVVNVQVVFSENIAVTGTPEINLALSPSTSVASYGSISGGNTMNFTYTVESGKTTTDLDYENTSSLVLNGGTIKDVSGNDAILILANPGAANSLGANKDIVFDGALPQITAALTLDVDKNGKIDHYKLTFNKAVDDSSFPGYQDTDTLGIVTTKWIVFNYSNVQIDPTIAVDVDNDNVIYLKFTEGSTFDTDIKPDLTTTATPELKDSLNNTFAQLFTASIAESDGASPIIVTRTGSIGGNNITITFSESIWGATGMPSCGSGGELIASDLIYTDGNSSAGALAFTTVSDNCGTDKTVTINVDNVFISSDNQDTITANSNTVYDAANNALVVSSLAHTPTLVNGPTLIAASSQKYDQVVVTFNEIMKAGVVDGSAECNSGSTCYDKYRIPGITVTKAESSSPGNPSATFTLTTSAQEELTLYTITVPSGSVQRNSDGETIQSVDNTENFYGDGRPSVASTSDSNCNDVLIEYDQDMTSGSGTLIENVDYKLNYQITSCIGTCTGTYADLSTPVSADSVSWNSSTRIATVNFVNDMSSSDIYTITVKDAFDTNSNSIAPGTYTVVNGCAAGDTVKPVLDNASAPTGTTVLLTFSEEVDDATANNAANYSIIGLTVSTAIKSANGKQVMLITSQQGGGSYTAVVTGVKDLNNNTIEANGVTNLQPFMGSGAGIPQNFDAGSIYQDPFNDNLPSGMIFVYNSKLHVGPSSSEGSVFEMSYDMGTSQTVTLDADDSMPGNQTFKNLNYNILWANQTVRDTRVLAGIDYFYSACVGASPPTLTGDACTTAGGTEYNFIGGYFKDQSGLYSDFWYTTDKGTERTYHHRGGLSTGGLTYRTMQMTVYKKWFYIALQVQGGGAIRFTKVCADAGGCTDSNGSYSQWDMVDLTGKNLYKLGRGGVIKNSYESTMLAIDVMYEHDNDGTGGNDSQLYIANGGKIDYALGTDRDTEDHSDGGILRTNATYSTTSSSPLNCSSGANCQNYWEDVTPSSQKWLDYMSITLPIDTTSGQDWDNLLPANKILHH